ncbi:MAG: adenine/guanine/hypoxanthine permease, partial [Archaeoglobaceae archaeon]|nr:adenine/guanine/hypoxanthine permease [Archaeoglobaceae archaeon]
GVSPAPESLFALPTLDKTFLQLDFIGLLNVGAIGVVFAFFMVDFFDTLGTVSGLSAKAGFMRKDGSIPDSEKILMTDAFPIAAIIPSAATAPALILVGFLMLTVIRDIDFSDLTEALPAFAVLVTIPFTYSIADGIGAGFISYVALKMLAGRWREIHPLMFALAVVFALYFLYRGEILTF